MADARDPTDRPGFRPPLERRRRAARAFVPGVLVTALLAGCQSYEPRPLDPEGHRDAWHARTVDESAVRPFLERLADGDGDAPAPFDPTDGLQLCEGRLVALAYNPDLRLARLRAGRAAVQAEHAGRWADPQFSINVLRLAQSVPDPWLIAPSLTFTLPLSGRLGAERELAGARHAAAKRRALEAEWDVWCDVEVAWIAWSAALLRAAETERFVATLNELVPRMAQLAEQGELARTEARLFELEAGVRAHELRRLRGDVAVLEERLRAELGLAPEAPVTLEPLALPRHPTAAPERGDVLNQNPSLQRLRRDYDVSEQALRREIRKQYPDLTIGPTFESEAGQSRFGLTGGLPLPFFNRNRQGIAAARVAREIARAAYEGEYERLIGRWSAAHARAVAAAAQHADLVSQLVPLVDRQLADALELLQLGEGSSLVLLESLTRAHGTKLDLIETTEREALAWASLARLTGPAPPATTDRESKR